MVKIYSTPNSKKGEKEFHLGKVEAGTSKEVTLYIWNDTKSFVTDMKIEISNKDIRIENFPLSMKPFEEKSFKIIWKPSLDFKKGLNVKLNLELMEEYRP